MFVTVSLVILLINNTRLKGPNEGTFYRGTRYWPVGGNCETTVIHSSALTIRCPFRVLMISLNAV